MKQYDSIRFELFKSEHVSDNAPLSLHEVKIFINNQELNELLNSIENRLTNLDRDAEIVYARLEPGWLLSECYEKYYPEEGAFVNCCSSCGDPECWGVHVHIEMKTDEVIWHHFYHNHRDYVDHSTFLAP